MFEGNVVPYCGCFHDFELTSSGGDSYDLRVALEGQIDLKWLFDETRLASTIVHLTPSFSQYSTGIRLNGVADVCALRIFCSYLKSTLILDLTPNIDHCHALGPYTLFPGGSSLHSGIGDLVHKAKYQRDQDAINDLLDRLVEFIDSSPILSESTALAVPPKSAPSPFDLPMIWADAIADKFHWKLVNPKKTRQTEPQKNYEEVDNEHDAVARIRDSATVEQLPPSSRVLMLDDTIGSGGTLTELARALRQAGAESVYGLSAAKDAKFTFGGIDLDRDSWL